MIKPFKVDYMSLDRAIPHPFECFGGGGKGGGTTTTTIAATPEPPPPAEQAKMTEYVDPNTSKQKQKAKTQGATSLQIPLGGVSNSASIGTA